MLFRHELGEDRLQLSSARRRRGPTRISGAGSSIASIIRDHVAARVGQRHHLAPPVGRIGCSHHQSAILEVVDRDRGRRRVHGRRRATCFTVIGPLASRRSTRIRLNGSPLRSTTARFQLSRLSITSEAIARQTSSAIGLSDMGALPVDRVPAISGASRSADASRPRRRRERCPSAKTTTPSADADEPQRPGRGREVRARRRQRRPGHRTAQRHTDTHADLPAGRGHRRRRARPVRRHAADGGSW